MASTWSSCTLLRRRGDSGVLQVYSVLGVLPAQDREALLLQLLQANLFGADTGGATLAVDGDHGGEIVLCRSLAADTLAAPAFVQLVEQFVAVAEAWKERLASWRSSAPAAQAHDPAAVPQPPAVQRPGLEAFLRA